jgi:hypothetical protein
MHGPNKLECFKTAKPFYPSVMNTLAYLPHSQGTKKKRFCEYDTSGLYYKHILTIVSDDRK